MRQRVLILVSKPSDNYSAHAPDVPGCVATGDTLEETVQLMQEALQMHFEGTLEDGDLLPELTTVEAVFVDVEVDVPATATRTAGSK